MPKSYILTSLLATAGALVSSGVVLLLLIIFLKSPLIPERTVQISAWYPTPGTSQLTKTSELIIPTVPNTGIIIRAKFHPVQASAYPLLLAQITGRTATTEVAVLWRTDTHPTALNKYILPWTVMGSLSVLNLGAIRQWAGQILDFGIVINGSATKTIHIHSMQLVAPSALGWLQELWANATSFEGFHGYSINFIHGGASIAWPLGLPLIAVWIILAELLLIGWQWLNNKTWQFWPLALVFLTGWLLLDARWQLDLLRQYTLTQYQYAGQTAIGKRLNNPDSALFRLALAIKATLPKSPQKILLIPSDTDSTRALLLRASYYLRPHNVYAADAMPLCQHQLSFGYYIVTLGESTAMRYTSGKFTWKGCAANTPESNNAGVSATRLISTSAGQLFRVTAPQVIAQ